MQNEWFKYKTFNFISSQRRYVHRNSKQLATLELQAKCNPPQTMNTSEAPTKAALLQLGTHSPASHSGYSPPAPSKSQTS